MPDQTLVLLDTAANVPFQPGELRPSQSSGDRTLAPWSVTWRTCVGGVSEGVQVVDISNGDLSFSVLPTRGMGIWKGKYRDTFLGWNSPVQQPVHPAFVNLTERNNLGWLNGFNELVCRCGLAFNGPPGMDGGDALTLHGRIANLPAHRVTLTVKEGEAACLELCGEVAERTVFGANWLLKSTLRFQSGSASVSLIDEITNLGGKPTHLSLLYHINVGRPFLEAGARWHAPFREIAPRDACAAKGLSTYSTYRGPDPEYAEEVFFCDPLADSTGWSTALLANSTASRGFAVHYQMKTLPRLIVWKNTIRDADGYVTGLEPAVNYPNLRGFERENGRLPLIAPGGTYRTELSLEVADTAQGVAAISERINRLQQGIEPVVHPQPRVGWSPS